MGKEEKVSDLFGEKLNEYHVAPLLKDIFEQYSLQPNFYMVAPEKINNNGKISYSLFLQPKISKERENSFWHSLAQSIEEKLQENYHYQYCRRIGQLSHLSLFLIKKDSKPMESFLDMKNTSSLRLTNPSTFFILLLNLYLLSKLPVKKLSTYFPPKK